MNLKFFRYYLKILSKNIISQASKNDAKTEKLKIRTFIKSKLKKLF